MPSEAQFFVGERQVDQLIDVKVVKIDRGILLGGWEEHSSKPVQGRVHDTTPGAAEQKAVADVEVLPEDAQPAPAARAAPKPDDVALIAKAPGRARSAWQDGGTGGRAPGAAPSRCAGQAKDRRLKALPLDCPRRTDAGIEEPPLRVGAQSFLYQRPEAVLFAAMEPYRSENRDWPVSLRDNQSSMKSRAFVPRACLAAVASRREVDNTRRHLCCPFRRRSAPPKNPSPASVTSTRTTHSRYSKFAPLSVVIGIPSSVLMGGLLIYCLLTTRRTIE